MTLTDAIKLSRFIRLKHWRPDKYHYYDEVDHLLKVPGTEIIKSVITIEQAICEDWEPYFP